MHRFIWGLRDKLIAHHVRKDRGRARTVREVVMEPSSDQHQARLFRKSVKKGRNMKTYTKLLNMKIHFWLFRS